MVGPVEGHCDVWVVHSGISGVVEQTHSNYDGRRQLAVSERDVEILVGLVREQLDGGSVEPGKAKSTRQLGASIAGVVEVHDIVHVLEGEPLVLGEEVERTEGGRATNDCLVSAQLLHAYDVRLGEVEGRGVRIQTFDDGLGVRFLVLLEEYC